MGDGEKITKTTGMENLSLGISSNRFSRDLLQRFMGSSSSGNTNNDYEVVAKEEEEEGDDEIELNLGLSLGGRFGVDKTKLIRSSSIASCLPVVRDDADTVAPVPPVAYSSLMRTSSLPVETEEAWRKRKELQTLRRMEAKRRRSEKQKNSKEGGGGGGGGGGGSLSMEERKEIEVNLRERLERDKCLKKLGSSVGLSAWAAAAASQAILRSGSDVALALAKGKGRYVGSNSQGFGQQASQGSVESKGGSSSSLTDLESKSLQGSTGELSPASIQSLQKGNDQNIGSSGTRATENTSKSETELPSRRSETSRNRGRETGTNSLEDMPCVFTKGDGPNGKRVDGILYKYGKGEEVRIMCVCHGNFHSPGEFVKHAGGTDVDHPLKHIVIKPNSSSLV
ncbi:hypothetical protein RD792_015360 [Penstemon davidsonii]|uniref:Ninja-family protein n=1 Tax=Penstemon davidsonii TaxID=160366 RepID=A0ABR0CRT5_9LAMI|nr:hypothetical protein RD792_015360 [Penstemon davidsonii]